ncbi:rhamnonate dehydratase [Alkanindiges hydrocarboniclasticus]|uniref:Rhamnonate dehydratase n=1 Tax=Alkanindiges hydrocarboniclasticus TaxID=1907941 RepID=A0A1S8CY73_9GAMM|nr:LrgB family protein [Alkanindiges hydrocarboniclasticus]ONG41760.1 rhamnonate dehydratase [Alkanindiges hydrocarboniclasticus]
MLLVIAGFALTLVSHILARFLGQYFPRLPVIVIAMFIVLALLWLVRWPYDHYIQQVDQLFRHLLGYVTVALAIPLAAIRLDDVPLKALISLFVFATLTSVAVPMGLAYAVHLSSPTVLAFATRAVTTPIALNIASLIHAPLAMVTLIVILSGLIGAALSPIILRKLDDERAAGLALGLAAHAIGTVQAWQRGPVAGRYAAFGMAVNGILTAIWLPLLILNLP